MTKSNENGSKIYLYCICGVAVLGGLLFGYDTAVISGAEQALQKYFIAGLHEFYDDSLHGFVVSSALVGCIIGGYISGILANNFGRRNTLILASIFFFLSALGSYMPEFLFRSGFQFYQPGEATKGLMWAFVLYRVLGGVGVGVASALCPMYIAEVAPANIRGTLVSWNQFAIIFGQLVVYAINTFIRKALGDTPAQIDEAMISVGWRRMFVSEAFPAAAFGILLLFVPKTPRFLVMKDQTDKAVKVLSRINGESKAEEILQEIKETINEEENKSYSLIGIIGGILIIAGSFLSFIQHSILSWGGLIVFIGFVISFFQKGLLSYGLIVILVGVLLSFFQQAVGINVVLYYAPRIFESMGFSGDAAMLQTVVMGVVNIVFTVVAILTVDRWGRRPLLMVGSVGMAIGMFALSILCFNNVINAFALVFIIIYTASFMMSWGPICWVLISEIFPNTIRSNAVAVAVAAQWISNLIVSSTFPTLLNFSAGGTYLIYAVFSVLSIVFVFFLVPETKGKTLEDMTNLWRSKMRKHQNEPDAKEVV